MNIAQKTAARLFINRIKSEITDQNKAILLHLETGKIYVDKQELERKLKEGEISLIKGFCENIAQKHNDKGEKQIIALTLIFWKDKERGTDLLISFKEGGSIHSEKIENFFI